jgi:hypothetical protein
MVTARFLIKGDTTIFFIGQMNVSLVNLVCHHRLNEVVATTG